MALFLFMTLAAWSMGSAVGGSPDEDWVLTNIWCSNNGNSPECKREINTTDAFALPKLVAEPHFCYVSQGQNQSAACQEMSTNQIIVKSNFTLQPSKYFDVAGTFVSPFVESSVVKLRFFNSFLGSLLVVSAAAFLIKDNSDLLIAWLAVIAPVTIYFISSVNTSSWTLVGTTCFTLAFIAALKNWRQPKYWAPTGLIVLISLWLTNSSRREGKYAILMLALATLFSEFAPKKNKVSFKSVLALLVVFPIIFFIFKYFSTFYAIFTVSGNLNFFDDPRIEVTEGITTSANNLLINNLITLPRFITGFFGSWGLGWFELELTNTVWLFTLQAFLLVTVFALRKSSNVHRLIFGAFFAMMCIAILYANQQRFAKVGEYIQPRYFLPFFLGIVIIAASNKTERFPNSLVITVAILATISNSIALRDTIRRYTTGQDVLISKSLNNPIEWWWQFGPQPETIWLTGTLSFAVLWAILICERNNESKVKLSATTSRDQ
jgi:hypothetical protein